MGTTGNNGGDTTGGNGRGGSGGDGTTSFSTFLFHTTGTDIRITSGDLDLLRKL